MILGIVFSAGMLWSQTPAELFNARCGSCHQAYIPQAELLKNYEHNNSDLNLSAPTLTELSFRLRDQVGDRRADKESQLLDIEEFLLRYVNSPNREQSILPRGVLKHFKTMPAMKLTEEEAEELAPYMFDFSEKMMIEHSVPRHSYQEALAIAQKEDKIVLIEGYIPFCRGCMKMDREVLVDDRVKKALKQDFVVVKLNVLTQKLPLGLKSIGTPAFFFITKDGKRVIDQIQGTGTVEEFLDLLALIKEQLKK